MLVAFGVVVLLVLGIMLLVLLEVVGTKAEKSADRFEKNCSCCFLEGMPKEFFFGSHLV